MLDKFKFPKGGFDVPICRKRDIVEAIDATNIDKEVLEAIVTQCESDANIFLREGRWTGIPYLGNMRVPKHRAKFKEIKGHEILETAKETLDEEEYRTFRRQFNADIAIDLKRERLYKYRTSCFVTRHRSIYNDYLKDKRAEKLSDKNIFARFMCFSLIDLQPFNPEE